jgi:hypothetical protein
MEESSQNENKMNNNDEIYLNNIVVEDEIMKKLGMQPSLQTKRSINVNEGNKKKKLKILHFQRKKWKHDSRNSLCWSFCYVNDNKPIDVKCFQLIRCNICYAN